MILVKNVNKTFGSTQVLQDISFEVGRGEIVGFLGQNGAGKTTLMRIITSYYLATSGTVEINGLDIVNKSHLCRKIIGYLPENPPLYLNLTVKEYLKYSAALKDVESRRQKVQVDKVLADCNLKDVEDKHISILSKGYKQRVGIAQAIINDPQVLILDEPTIGLDPLQILQMRELIKRVESERTVIISTHILSEIEQMAKRVLVIKQGKIIVDQALDHMLEERDFLMYEFSIKGEKEKLLKIFNSFKGLTIESFCSNENDHVVRVNVKKTSFDLNEQLKKVLKINAEIFEVKIVNPSLEEVFINNVS